MDKTPTLTFGDTIIHRERPEWGRGVVSRVESVPYHGSMTQRVHVRFSAAGLKVLNVAVAKIEVVERSSVSDDPVMPIATVKKHQVRHPITQQQGANNKSTPDTPAAKKQAQGTSGNTTANTPASLPSNGTARPASRAADAPKPTRASLEKAMLILPEEVRDPFTTVWNRLERTLALYRITDDPRHVTLWAVSQMSLDDPLSIFSRQELEVFFKRWERLRDEHLRSVLADAEKTDADKAAAIMQTAPAAARDSMRRHNARR
ncbi:MAG: DUF3553 domain-containing protein [Planctomycetes bacterium]|nr:DUF3553 domain-containing protein [Planctomycetota bacterium]